MYILGLTGGLASGKSTVAGLFKALGAAVVDADALVHQLQGPGTPQTTYISQVLGKGVLTADGGLDRRKLAAMIAGDQGVLTFLEGVLHPAVRVAEADALRRAAAGGCRLAVLDVPLLFEAGSHHFCDSSAVCDVDDAVRKARAFERPGMTEEKWAALKKRRLPDAAQRQLAQHLIPTGGPLADTQKAVEALYAELLKKPAEAWPTRWADELATAKTAERR